MLRGFYRFLSHHIWVRSFTIIRSWLINSTHSQRWHGKCMRPYQFLIVTENGSEENPPQSSTEVPEIPPPDFDLSELPMHLQLLYAQLVVSSPDFFTHSVETWTNNPNCSKICSNWMMSVMLMPSSSCWNPCDSSAFMANASTTVSQSTPMSWNTAWKCSWFPSLCLSIYTFSVLVTTPRLRLIF